jgi:hypothetical protein
MASAVSDDLQCVFRRVRNCSKHPGLYWCFDIHCVPFSFVIISIFNMMPVHVKLVFRRSIMKSGRGLPSVRS